VLPPNTVVHQQDWFLTDRYVADLGQTNKTFLAESSERHFNERPFLRQESYLFLTRKPNRRPDSTSALSSLIRGQLFPADATDPRQIQVFRDQVSQFIRILEDCGLISVEPLTATQLWSTPQRAGLIQRYFTLSDEATPTLVDIDWKPEMRIGDRHGILFTLADTQHLPSLCGPRIDYGPYSTDRTRYSIGFAAALGPLLYCDHIYNQYLFIDDPAATIKQLEAKRLRLQSLSSWSRANAVSEEAINAFLNEAVEEQRLPIRAHFNVFAWTATPTETSEIRNRIGTAITQLEASPHLETVGAPQIWWAGIPGNEVDLPINETFRTLAEQAVCFLSFEENYRTSRSSFGLRLADRLTGYPIHVDIDDEPRKTGLISNGNMFVLSGSGGGKSFGINHLVREYYDQGAHVFLIDIGHSYEIQCALHGGYYFTYRETDPIRFNPFYLAPGDEMDTEKKESIKTLLLALWKKSTDDHNRAEYVALSTALQGYFDKTAAHPELFPCFDTFYEYLKEEFATILTTEKIKDRDFDLANLLYVLRPFYKGGEFDYLLNARSNLDLLHERFIVFELDNIKSHPILFPVVTLIIMELFVSKMRKLKGIRKMIVIEEAWKAIAKEGMAEYIKYLFKTVRKFFGEAIVVTQEVDDIIQSPIVKESIINNSDCKILLDQRKYMNKFDDIQAMLGLTDKEKSQILSINMNNDAARLYKEVWIGLGGTHSAVYATEVSMEEYLAYTTEEMEKVEVMQLAHDLDGNVEQAIKRIALQKRENDKDY